MPVLPETVNDTVFYTPKRFYSLENMRVDIESDSALDIYGNVYINGFMVNSDSVRVLRPSGGDDTAAIQAAADALAPGGTLIFTRGVFNTSGTITFGKVNVQMPIDQGFAPNTSGFINYTGSGTAVVFDRSNYCDVRISVKRSALEWDKGTDLTSEGIVFRNCNNIRAAVVAVSFWRGVVLRGDNAGTCYSSFDIVKSDLNKTCLLFDVIGTGWVNQNTITGQLRESSGATSYAGTCLLDMSYGGNGNTFINLCLEGSTQETTWKVAYTYNVFIGCRFEAVPANSCQFLATATGNIVVGGYANLGPGVEATAPFLFLGASAGTNIILGGAGTHFGISTAFGPRGIDLCATTGSSPVAVTLRNVTATRGELDCSGRYTAYVAAGKEADPTPIVMIDGSSTTRGIRFGYDGTPDVARLYTYNASFLALIGSLIWGTHNTHDVGAAANACRNMWVGSALTVGTNIKMSATVGGTNGSYVQFPEQTTDSSGAPADTCRLFAKDNGSGKTQLVVRFPTGVSQVIATEP